MCNFDTCHFGPNMGLYGCEYSAENVFISVYKHKTLARQASYDVSRVTLKFQLHV